MTPARIKIRGKRIAGATREQLKRAGLRPLTTPVKVYSENDILESIVDRLVASGRKWGFVIGIQQCQVTATFWTETADMRKEAA